MTAVRIKVLRRALYEDIAKEYGGREINRCEVFHEGQEFISGWAKPEGFCDWAWNDIYKPFITLLTNGSFKEGLFNGWMKDSNTNISCCTDGFRPVTFLLERIDTKNLLDLSGVHNAAPLDAYASERWGEFSYAFTGLEAGKNYQLRLHFAEIFFTDAGKRIFNIDVNGKRVIENFDIFTAAGGAHRALIKELPVSADAGGKITIGFVKGSADMPKISAIEVLSDPASGGKALFAINAGGAAAGGFEADCRFTGGNVTAG